MIMEQKQLIPKYSKVGDIFLSGGHGTKPGRPYVVVGKIICPKNGISVLCIPLTTKESWAVAPAKKCRFLKKKSYFTNQIISFGMAKAQDNFIGIYEDLSHLKEVKIKILDIIKSGILY